MRTLFYYLFYLVFLVNIYQNSAYSLIQNIDQEDMEENITQEDIFQETNLITDIKKELKEILKYSKPGLLFSFCICFCNESIKFTYRNLLNNIYHSNLSIDDKKMLVQSFFIDLGIAVIPLAIYIAYIIKKDNEHGDLDELLELYS